MVGFLADADSQNGFLRRGQYGRYQQAAQYVFGFFLRRGKIGRR
jgi:hypothetical protein